MLHKDTKEPEFVLSLADFLDICQKSLPSMMRIGLISGALILAFSLTRPLRYHVEGTFKEKAKTENSASSSISTLLLLGGDKDNPTIPMLKSKKILKTAIKQQNFQGSIQPENHLWLPFRVMSTYLTRVKDNLLVEYASLTNSRYPLIEEPPKDLTLEKITYEQEVPLQLTLEVCSKDNFNLYYKNTPMGTGSFGKPFSGEGFEFTVIKNNHALPTHARFNIDIQPFDTLINSIAKELSVVADYNSSSFLTLKISYTTRRGASQLLNGIMDAYRQHLIGENHSAMAEQIAYLKMRQAEINEDLTKLMEKHAQQVSTHAGNLELLISTQQELQRRLLAINLNIKHLKKALHEGSYLQGHLLADNPSSPAYQTMAEIQRYKQQCATLDLLLKKKTLENGCQPAEHREFKGLDLETANHLYLTYSRELQELETSSVQQQFLIEKLKQPGFELSSLATVLNDPVSCDIIAKASAASLAVQDQANRTNRELERLEQELDTHKLFLANHLKQANALLNLKINVLKEKIMAVQASILELTQERIAIQEKQLLDQGIARVHSLEQEKEVILHQKEGLQAEFDKIPQQWAMEKIVDLYLQTQGSLMQQIGNLIESKNISDHIDTTLSMPFDVAKPPLHAKPRYLLLFTLLGFLLGGLLALVRALVGSLLKGIVATAENLQHAGQHVCGVIDQVPSSPKDMLVENLATQTVLFRLLQFILPEKQASNVPPSVLLLDGYGPSYIEQLSELLSQRQLKVLWLPFALDGKAQAKEISLMHYLESGAELPTIIKEKSCARLITSKVSFSSLEMLHSKRYKALLEHYKEHYDVIVTTLDADPLEAATQGLISLFDSVVITLSQATLQQLRPYLIAEQKVSFILAKTKVQAPKQKGPQKLHLLQKFLKPKEQTV